MENNIMKRLIMHVDMDAFFASVEQMDHPEYRGKPLIVGGLEGRGVVSTCSYEARKFGVHSAMPVARAQRLCPQGIFIRGNYPRYSEVSHEIFKIFSEFSPVIEPLSIDEAFLDITGMERLMKSPEEYAKRLKKEIVEKTGIVASVGIAPNKFLAKIASDLDKPDGLVVIPEERVHEILDELPVTRIWGVGKKTSEILSSMRIRKVRDIRNAEYSFLASRLGDNMASHLKQLAEGIDNRPVAPRGEAKSVGKEITFTEDLQNAEDAEAVLLDLSTKVGWRLRKNKLKGRTIQLKLRKSDFTTYTRSKTIPEQTCYDREIYEIARELFRKLGIFHGIRLLGVAVSSFEQGEFSLFNDNEKKDKLYAAMDEIKAKFGEKGIMKAKLMK